ncbi:rRNA maturation RNase YbeY [Candidatus Falkowbacteria bacterium]|nr:rRNA maturation RNase YbeY [Candidatus Falkowbacteria bacterium]
MVAGCNLTRQIIDLNEWQRVAQLFLDEQQAVGEVSLVLVGDQRIRQLNRQYRHQDKITDVLSFVADEVEQLGEVVIDYQQIIRQARRFNNSTWCELIFITTHGLLHLLGHNDETTSGWKTMEKISQEFIDQHNIC